MQEYMEWLRAQYPQYDDLSDSALAHAVHEKAYADLSFADFERALSAKAAQARPPKEADSDALAALNASGGSAVGDFGRLLLQGVTFNQAHRLLGDKERVDALRELHPFLAGATEAAGGSLVPAGAIGKIRGASKAKSVSPLTASLVGGASGAAGSAAYAAGEGEPIGPAAIGGGALGALIAGGAGAAGRAMSGAGRMVRGRMTGAPSAGERVARDLTRRADLDPDVTNARRMARELKDYVSDEFYRPLEEQFDNMTDERLTDFLMDEKFRDFIPAKVRRRIGDGSVSLRQVQDIRSSLTRQAKTNPSFRTDLEDLHDILDEIAPEFRVANRAWREASKQAVAIEDGVRAWNWDAARVAEKTRLMAPEEVDRFNDARGYEIVRRLMRSEDKAAPLLREFMDAGPSTRAQIRTLFGDNDVAYQAFLADLKREASASKLAKHLALVAGGAAAGVAARKFGVVP